VRSKKQICFADSTLQFGFETSIIGEVILGASDLNNVLEAQVSITDYHQICDKAGCH
jgi:hypothetical protein